ncbi:hypothetical protein HYW75_02335 [Candidatus Pacearchaeota archaeon]|nr:hypothetical protein [Candidatus Pacearchaeota archaeon]
MAKCIFCGREEEPFRGIHLIKNDGSVNFFCSSKCRKNTLKLKRDKRRLKWTEAYRIALEKSRKAQKREEEKKTEKVNKEKEEIDKSEKKEKVEKIKVPKTRELKKG